jgi:CRP-like cAMP-binding protein
MDLERATLFSGVSKEVQEAIACLARISEYACGATIFVENDPAVDIYILREGEVELSYTLPQDPSSEIRIARISPGETFAWSALARGETLSAHARALVASSAFIIPADRLHGLLAQHPAAGYEIMTRLSGQILERLRVTRRELRWLHQGAR